MIPWTKEQIAILHEWAGKKPVSEIGSIVGRSAYATKIKLEQVGLGHVPAPVRSLRSRPWTEDEISVIREFASTLTAAQIGSKLNRTDLAVHHKAKTLGIPMRGASKVRKAHSEDYRKPWSQPEDDALRDLDGNSVYEIPENPAPSPDGVRHPPQRL